MTEGKEQLILFSVPKLEKTQRRRIARTAPTSGECVVSRRDRLSRRNRLIVARYYYWTELQRQRWDDTMRILADREFFIEERTVSNILLEEDAYYRELINNEITRRQLRRTYPGFDWN